MLGLPPWGPPSPPRPPPGRCLPPPGPPGPPGPRPRRSSCIFSYFANWSGVRMPLILAVVAARISPIFARRCSGVRSAFWRSARC
ncbi:MAG: hypothetical protein FJ379_06250 [Verrucomicrobia bacterium]|nr:hypothetical protein [Verrucomicrobiota bacterium]